MILTLALLLSDVVNSRNDEAHGDAKNDSDHQDVGAHLEVVVGDFASAADEDVDEDEELYTLDQIESAFDNVAWNKMSQDFIDNSDAYDSVEIEMTGRDEGYGTLTVEAEASFDPNNVEIDEKDLVNAVLDNL